MSHFSGLPQLDAVSGRSLDTARCVEKCVWFFKARFLYGESVIWDFESKNVQSQMKVIAAAFALCAFVIAIISGIAADNPGSQVILQAGITLLVCHIIGTCAAACFAHLVREHTELYISQRAIPSIDMSSQGTQSMVDDQDHQGSGSVGSTAQGNQKNYQKSANRG